MMKKVFIVLVHGKYSSIYIHNGLGNKYKNCKEHVFKYRTLLKTVKIIKTAQSPQYTIHQTLTMHSSKQLFLCQVASGTSERG